METPAYQQYRDEASGWLKQGRIRLIESLLRRHLPPGHDHTVLDLGAGVGQNIAVLSQFGTVDALERSPIGLEELGKNPHVRDVFATELPAPLSRRYDVIGAFDVVEHLERDAEAIDWVADHLQPGGLFIATVPAYNWMFSSHDVALEHHRRYTRGAFDRLLSRRLKVLQSGYFVSGLFPLAALSRLPSMLRYRLGKAQNAASKQSGSLPGPVSGAFGQVLAGEAWLIGKGIDLPFGLSVYAIAAKA
jgi:SAM-dependent methyltransferase